MGWSKSLSVPKGATLTVTGPAKSAHGFELLALAMSSKGTVVFNGPTELHDKKTGKLLATITGGSLPGTLHFTATAAGQNHGRKCVDDTKTMKGAGITCSAAKAMVGCSHDLHASFPKMPAGSLVSTICRVTCKACFSEPTRPGTVTKKVGGGKAVVKPKDLVQLIPDTKIFGQSLSMDATQQALLASWLSKTGGDFKLCYRKSRDGDGIAGTRKCAKHGSENLMVIKMGNGKVVGAHFDGQMTGPSCGNGDWIKPIAHSGFKSALRCGAKACLNEWTGIRGTKVRDLTRNKRFPNSPNAVRKLTSGRFEMRRRGNNLGALLEGFVKAPTTGRYTFSTHSDDSSEVWAARNAYTQEGLVKVVELTGCCRKINGRTQLSWTKGQAYYIRALVKEGSGGEYLKVGIVVGRKEYFPIPISMFTTIPPFCIGKATVGNTCSGTKASGTKQGHWLFSLTARAKYPATGNSKGWHVDCGKYVHYYDKIRAWDNSVRLNFDCQDASSHYKTAPRCHQFVGCNSGQQYPACPITELELWWR
jgi:hypothetical protein